jgi:hypothetical protein
MACDLSVNISSSATCDDYKVPGVAKLYLINESDLSGTTSQAILQDTNGEVTGMTLVSGATPYSIAFAEDTAFFTADEQINGGTRNFTHSVTFGVVANSQAILAALKQIGIGRFLCLIQTNDENWRLLGTDSKRLRASALSDLSGQAAGDDVSTTVTIDGVSKQLPPFVDADVITSLGIS